MSVINTNQLVELLQKCSSGPWQLSMNDFEEWSIRTSGTPQRPFVMRSMPQDVTPYDRRLLGMAWELAVEVLRLRSGK